MSPDGWGYIHRRLLKSGVKQLEDYVTKRGKKYHSYRAYLIGMHIIWAGARKKRPKIDTQAKHLCINDAWNVVVPRPTSDTPNPHGVSYGKYDLLFEPTQCTFKIWIEYKKQSSIEDTRISEIMKSNQIPASAAAFRDNWDTDVEVKVGTKFIYSDVNGSYLLEIVSANVSDVTCKIVRSKNNTTCPLRFVHIPA
eukprot:scaffold10208_cov69-Attheya_sp.AAC.2